MRTRIKHNNAVCVVGDLILVDPAETCLNAEDALLAGLADFVVDDHSVAGGSSSKSNVCFVVGSNNVLLDVRIS